MTYYAMRNACASHRINVGRHHARICITRQLKFAVNQLSHCCNLMGVYDDVDVHNIIAQQCIVDEKAAQIRDRTKYTGGNVFEFNRQRRI